MRREKAQVSYGFTMVNKRTIASLLGRIDLFYFLKDSADSLTTAVVTFKEVEGANELLVK